MAVNSSSSLYRLDIFGAGRSPYWTVLVWSLVFACLVANSPWGFATFLAGTLIWRSLVHSLGADLFPGLKPRMLHLIGLLPLALFPALFASLWFARGETWLGLFWSIGSALGFVMAVVPLAWKPAVELGEDCLAIKGSLVGRRIPYSRIKSLDEHVSGLLRLLYAPTDYVVVRLARPHGLRLPGADLVYLRIDRARRSEFTQELTEHIAGANRATLDANPATG